MMSQLSPRPRPRHKHHDDNHDSTGRRRNYFPVSRVIIILPVVAFLIALGLQAALKVAGFDAGHPLRILLTPAVGGVVVFFGLRWLPRRSRFRMAIMVAVVLFIFAFFV